MRPTVFIAFPLLIMLLISAIVLLVLFIKLCIKKPKLAVVIVLVPILLIGAIVLLKVLNVEYINNNRGIRQYQTQRQMWDVDNNVLPSIFSNGQSPIWSEGIEDEFIADVYPSKESAVRSLILRFGEHFRAILQDSESQDSVILTQNSQNAELVEKLQEAILKHYPDIICRIQTRDATIQSNEVEIRLAIINKDSVNRTILIERPPTRGGVGYVPRVQDLTYETGTIRANISHNSWSTGVNVDYIEKNWVENLAYFLNSIPNLQLMVAKSSESCLTQTDANQKAMESACVLLGSLIQIPVTMLSSNDILENNMIVDRFVQSFDGSAGTIWREALLLDVSPEKLNRLADNIAYISRVRRFSFLRTIVSVAGLFLLICIVYAFLNAATKGYYTWSLRIVGVVLVLILIFLLF